LSNNLLPSRLGELVRTVLISRAVRLGATYVLATALTERIVDAVVLALVALAVAGALDHLPNWLDAAVRPMVVAGALGLAGVWSLPRLERPLGWLLRKTPLPARTRPHLEGLLGQFLLGMRALQRPQRA